MEGWLTPMSSCPRSIANSGSDRGTRIATPSTTMGHGWRATKRPQRAARPDPAAAAVRCRPKMRREFNLWPSSDSTAGMRVTAESTAVSTARHDA